MLETQDAVALLSGQVGAGCVLLVLCGFVDDLHSPIIEAVILGKLRS